MKLIRTKTYCDICESCSGSCPCCTQYIDMIEFKTGDMFQSGCEALVNTVNCVGVMGAGLALVFKKKYPEMYKDYRKFCLHGNLRPGKLHVWENNDNPKYIINFPTKDHWSNLSKMEYITSGLEALKELVIEKNIKTIAMPSLGCGLGNLKYEDVKIVIENWADFMPENVKITLYEPH